MKVVHCRYSEYTHYIGRPSSLANRYTNKSTKFSTVRGKPVVVVGSVEEAITGFELDALNDPKILIEIRELPADAILGCWCKPGPCHGDVIITLWKEMNEPQRLYP